MKKIYLILLLCLPITAFAQLEASWWFFGENASLRFNPDPLPGPNGSLNTFEGCSTISDRCGILQMYSDGSTIWDRNGNIMNNGTGLSGNSTSAQSAIIIPDLQVVSRYFVVTISPGSGLEYSVVDMTLFGGLGGVVPGRKNLPIQANVQEKVTAALNADGTAYWIVTFNNGTYTSYLAGGGVVTAFNPINSVIPASNFLTDARGYIRLSPDGSKIANTSIGNAGTAVLCDFNNRTGIVSNPILLTNGSSSSNRFYGAEFSTDSQLLYLNANSQDTGNGCGASNVRQVIQFNLNGGAGFNNNPVNLGGVTGTPTGRGGLQLGIDGKIYQARTCQPWLGVITSPNTVGVGAGYIDNGVALGPGQNSREGLPPFITSFFEPSFFSRDSASLPGGGTAPNVVEFCDGTIVQFQASTGPLCPTSTVSWDFGDGATSTALNPTHAFPAPGVYTVILTITTGTFMSSATDQITIYEVPVANPVVDVTLCDSDMNNMETYDLRILETPQVLGAQTNPDFVVTYHLTLNAANNNTAAITNPYNFTNATTRIYARITNNANATSRRCFDVVEFDVIVTPGVGASRPMDLINCDDNNDGFSIFDLTSLEPQILGSLPAAGFDITFHTTAAGAAGGILPITNPATYTNTTIDQQRIFIRLESNGNAGCTSTTEVDLFVYDTPTANPVTDIALCDTGNDGMEDVTLTQFDAEVLGSQTAASYTITYHASQADADADTGNLASPYTVNGTTRLFARIENNLNAPCYDTTSFEIRLDAVPVANAVADFRLCDDVSNNGSENFNLATRDAEVLGSQNPADFNIQYFVSQADADAGTAGGASPVMLNYSSAGQILYVRIENVLNPTCYDTTSFPLIVDALPVAAAPANFPLCDDASNDGTENVDLTQFNTAVLNGQTNAAFVVSYHPTQADAQADTAAITAPFAAALGTNIIWARIDNSNNQTCSAVVSFNIVLSPLAIANAVNDYRLCDDATNDGFADFDLSTLNAQVLGAQAPATFNIAYFASQADADLGTTGGATALSTIYNSGNTTIFARIQTNANTTCFQTTPVNLFVDALPAAAAPTNLELCDDTSNNGTENVDLTQFNATVLNGQTNAAFVVSYHPTQADAQADTAGITAPFAASLGTNTIWARIDNGTNESCNSVVSFDIILSPLAIANAVSDYRICDDASNDGVEDFDLSTLNGQLLGAQAAAAFTIEYFTSQADADLGTVGGATALPITYNTGNTTIFARIQTNSNTTCFQTTSVNLFVDALPIAGTPANIIVCDDASNDGVEDVNLSQFDTAILNGQSAANFTVSYHANQADADADRNALQSPYSVSSATPNLYARIDNTNNGLCFTTTVFQFVVSASPTANPASDIVQCDDDSNDGITVFDLSAAGTEVLGNQDPNVYTISYHGSQNDADMNASPLPMMYTSTASTPETIYVRIQTNSNAQCFDTTTFEIEVSLQPTAGNAADLRGCDDPSNDGVEDFDLFSQDAAILNGQNPLDYDVTYHASQADADAGRNELSSPYRNTSLVQTIYARIENADNTGCYDTSTFVIEVFRRPVISNQGPITICAGIDQVLDAGPGYASYLWSTGETTRTITVNSEDDYTVTVTNNNGCDTTATIVVIESDIATIIRIDVEQFEVNTNQLAAIVTGSGDYEFSLDNFVYQDSPVFGNLYPGYYTVYIRDKNGCGTVSQDAVIIGGPPYFTPNQDGYHDTWQVIAVEEIPDANIYIFDRYGKLLKQISPTGIGWDGTYNGNPMPSSDYWYMVELADGRSFRGHFALKR